ncbi:MAG: hypothetical protein VYA34_12040 [Myxococcota bacterium]|nr:hypothetical protein [Myxococcota bacterium]
MNPKYTILSLFLLSCSCVTIQTVNIGQKTSLERQLMGDFQKLNEEEYSAISVRSKIAKKMRKQFDTKFRLLRARQRHLFNLDDLNRFLLEDCLREKHGWQLVTHHCDLAEKEAGAKELIDKLIREENTDRNEIFLFFTQRYNLNSRVELASLKDALQKLYLQSSPETTWFQPKENGAWRQRQQSQKHPKPLENKT